MKIQCTIEREGGTHITLGTTHYHFTPGPDGAHVAELDDPEHIARLLAIPEGYRIHGIKAATVPVHAIELTAAVQVPAAPETAPAVRKNAFPASFVIGGNTIMLEQVTAMVLAANDLDAGQWGELSDDEQSAKIESELDRLQDEAEQAEIMAQATAPKADPADTNGDGQVDSAEERAALVIQHQAKFGSKPHHKWSVQKIRDTLAAG